MNHPPTVEQLLVLADRAEFKGGLTQAEADRLRAGIRGLAAERDAADATRRLVAHRSHNATSKHRLAVKQLAAARALVRSARQRGARTVPVWILAAAIETVPEIRQGAA